MAQGISKCPGLFQNGPGHFKMLWGISSNALGISQNIRYAHATYDPKFIVQSGMLEFFVLW